MSIKLLILVFLYFSITYIIKRNIHIIQKYIYKKEENLFYEIIYYKYMRMKIYFIYNVIS